MHLRVAELLKARNMTVYRLAKESSGRISLTAAYRLARDEWKCLSRPVLEALCEVLEVEPGALIAPDRPRRKR